MGWNVADGVTLNFGLLRLFGAPPLGGGVCGNDCVERETYAFPHRAWDRGVFIILVYLCPSVQRSDEVECGDVA
jgi:hypothetical protein